MNVTVCSCHFFAFTWEEMFMTDEWSRLADMLANLIEKYALDLDIENLPAITKEHHTEDESNKADKNMMRDIPCK